MNLDPSEDHFQLFTITGFALLAAAAILYDLRGELRALRKGDHSVRWNGCREMRMIATVFVSAFLGALHFGQTGACAGFAIGCLVARGMLWLLNSAERLPSGNRSSGPGSESMEWEEE